MGLTRVQRDCAACDIVHPFYSPVLSYTGLIPRTLDYLMFVFRSTAGYVCMHVLDYKPALSQFSNALKTNALSFMHSFIQGSV